MIHVDDDKKTEYHIKTIARDTCIGYHVITLTKNK